MDFTRRDIIGVTGAAAAGALGLKEMVPEGFSDDVALNTDYDRMEVGNAVYLSAYTGLDVDMLSLEYQAPGNNEWETVENTVDGNALSYGFHEEVDRPGDYTFQARAYRDGEVRGTSDKEVVEFVDEIKSGL